jgi:oxygen-independent coproporphyrinogen-3 oxidase
MELRQRYVDAVISEAKVRTTDDAIETVYLGGGTPSQLTIPQLQQLFDGLYNIYKVAADAEVTLECNPDDVTPDFAEALKTLPVNRVSMGTQTFDNTRLRFLHRRHTSAQVSQAVERLRNAGISNISIDLMYGFPEETLDDWQHDIDAALALSVNHISAYCLMIEEGTALYQQMTSKGTEDLDHRNEELEREMYYLLIDRLEAAGYEHYELSNFARPGLRSRHNNSYWTDVPYIGLGATAHSYDGQQRRWNADDLAIYIRGIENGHPESESEPIDATTRYNDRVMLSLRTCEGLDLTTLSPQDTAYLLPLAKRYLDDGLLTVSGNHLSLSRQGLFVSDMIMADLMRV